MKDDISSFPFDTANFHEETEKERMISFALMEFVEAIENFGFFEMMYLLTKELKRRGYAG